MMQRMKRMKITKNDNDLYSDIKIERCSCGAEARMRYKVPVTWIECKKKCGMKTAFYTDNGNNGHCDRATRDLAIMEWNRNVKNGK